MNAIVVRVAYHRRRSVTPASGLVRGAHPPSSGIVDHGRLHGRGAATVAWRPPRSPSPASMNAVEQVVADATSRRGAWRRRCRGPASFGWFAAAHRRMLESRKARHRYVRAFTSDVQSVFGRDCSGEFGGLRRRPGRAIWSSFAGQPKRPKRSRSSSGVTAADSRGGDCCAHKPAAGALALWTASTQVVTTPNGCRRSARVLDCVDHARDHRATPVTREQAGAASSSPECLLFAVTSPASW